MIGYRYTACNRCQCVYELVIDASAPLTCVLLVCILIHGFNFSTSKLFNVRTSSWHWKVFKNLKSMPLRLSTSYFSLNKPLERKHLNWKPSSGLVFDLTPIIVV